MKVFSPLVVLTCCGLLATPLLAAETAPDSSGCLAKSREISQKIEEAKTNGNKPQQAGLEKALSENNANCTEASLLKDLEQKVLEAKREVKKRESDLEKAMKKGDPEKIDRRKNKLADARKQLQDAQTELEDLQAQD